MLRLKGEATGSAPDKGWGQVAKPYYWSRIPKDGGPGPQAASCECTLRVTCECTLRVTGSRGKAPGLLLILAFAFCTAAAPAPPTPVKQVRKAAAEGLLGQAVTDAKGDVFGHVVDVLIDADGRPRAAVVEFTGFFGIGNRHIAVAWDSLHFAVEQDHIAITVPLDAAKLTAMPEYRQEAASVPVATPAAAPAAHPPAPH